LRDLSLELKGFFARHDCGCISGEAELLADGLAKRIAEDVKTQEIVLRLGMGVVKGFCLKDKFDCCGQPALQTAVCLGNQSIEED